MPNPSLHVSTTERDHVIQERIMYLLRQHDGEMRFGDLADEMISRGWACPCFRKSKEVEPNDIIKIKNPLKRMQ